MQPEARWTLPATAADANRMLYFFGGTEIRVAGQAVSSYQGIQLRGDAAVELENGTDEGELLPLSGRPIGDPVAHYGPFVMNTAREIQQAIMDYQRTGFGGWPWKSDAPVHPRDESRFAVHADGRKEQAP
jgi:redox-sensitive bicupin YhaK (pirin superfamily)